MWIFVAYSAIEAMTQESLVGLYDNNKFLQSILETAIDSIIIINDRGIIIILNKSAADLFAYTKEELLGQNISILTPEPHRSNHDSYIDNHLRTGINKIIGIGREVEGVRKDGLKFPIRLAISKFILHDKIYFTGVIHDLSAQKEVENKLWYLNKNLETLVDSRTGQLQESIQQLSASNMYLEEEIAARKVIEAKLKDKEQELLASLEKERDLNLLKSRFVSIASHEFRTPLANILSSINLIDKYQNDESIDKRNRHIQKIKNNIHYLNGVLNEFLILTRIEESRLEIRMEEFSLHELLAEVIEDFEQIKKPGQLINFISTEESTLIYSDKTCLRHIMNNLIANAIKFSGESSSIHIRLDKKENSYQLVIADTGIGIPEEELKFIFDIFYRATNVLNIPGTGLGLNIVKKYLDAIHGSIQIESFAGKGTTITITLPIHDTKK
jgi:PAS domain S-box-containing protein